MEKPKPEERDLKDWDTKLTDEWIVYAQAMQTSHCRNTKANEAAEQYPEDLFHKIDDLVLIHVFGASTKKGPPHSDIKKNFNSSQCQAAEKIREKILKYGKIKKDNDEKSYVSIQVILVTMMLVDYPKEPTQEQKDEEPKQENKDKDETGENPMPGVSQVVVFRVITPDGTFCFIDHTGRYYKSWEDYLENSKLPRCKICFPKGGVYKMKEQSSSNVDENNNEKRFVCDLQLSESISCTDWERFKSGALTAVPYATLFSGVVSIVAAPFTGGVSVGVFATYAATTVGWISFSCMMIGAIANIGSIWDKVSHDDDESCLTEIASLAMLILHYGVAKYNAKMIDKLKYKVPVTRIELILMTVSNCFRFAVDSVMFLMTFYRLVDKACTEGIESITALELVQFSMSSYLFGKAVFEPKTGYGIIKEAQRRYVMIEKRANIQTEGGKQKYDEFTEGEERFGKGGNVQTIKDDWNGFTCSQEVCDELNANGDLIRNIDAFDDLNQFFLEVSDTDSNLRMTKDGNIMVNKQLEVHGRKLNEVGETKDGINERRRSLLKFTSDYQKGEYSDPALKQKVDTSINKVLGGVGNNNQNQNRIHNKDKILSNFRNELNKGTTDNRFNEEVSKALTNPDFREEFNNANTQDEVRAVLEKTAHQAEYQYNLRMKNFKFGDDRLFFEIDRKTIQTQFNNVTINGSRVFENMKVGQADRLWRTISNFGNRTNDIVEAAKTMAERLNKSDPREFADLMEFVEFKYTKTDVSDRADFMSNMKDPNSIVFQQTFNEFEEAIRAVREIQRDIDIPWSSETSAAYHYFKHGKDSFTVNANEAIAQNQIDNNPEQPGARYEQLKADMTKYLNEQWRQAVKPENASGQGHSQDGRTFRISYAFRIDENRTHYAFTARNPDTDTGTKLLSHFCPS